MKLPSEHPALALIDGTEELLGMIRKDSSLLIYDELSPIRRLLREIFPDPILENKPENVSTNINTNMVESTNTNIKVRTMSRDIFTLITQAQL